METSDVLYRVSGALMFLSGLLNAFTSFIWFITMIWVCVGVLWLIPMAIAALQVIGGLVMLATGRKIKLLAFIPLLGPIASICNFQFFAGGLDFLAICLGIGGFVTAGQADQLEDNLR